MFFVMMFVLGVGSAAGMTSSIVNAIHDQYPSTNYWKIVYPVCISGFIVGLVYVTPVNITLIIIKNDKIYLIIFINKLNSGWPICSDSGGLLWHVVCRLYSGFFRDCWNNVGLW